MLGQYLPVVALAVLAVLFASLSIFASRLLAPNRKTIPKISPYECGVEPADEGNERHSVKFFLVAMLFIVFDVEIIFLYPWAVSLGAIGLFGFVAVLIFSFAVFESFLYLISNGALNWGPAKTAVMNTLVTPQRTAASTTRRVGA